MFLRFEYILRDIFIVLNIVRNDMKLIMYAYIWSFCSGFNLACEARRCSAPGKGIMSNLLGFKLLLCNSTKPSVLNQNLFSASILLPSISSPPLFLPSKQSDSLTLNSRTRRGRATSDAVLSNFRASKHYSPALLFVDFLSLLGFFGNFCFLGRSLWFSV